MWEYSAFPVWGGPLGAMRSPVELSISPALRGALQAWNDACAETAWGPTGPDAPDYVEASSEVWGALDAEGLRLTELLRLELGPTVVVEFQAHQDDADGA
jgi:hypothetical protein